MKAFRTAVVYGNVMGSFAVEDFGLTRLLNIGNEEITKRFRLYQTLTQTLDFEGLLSIFPAKRRVLTNGD